MLILPHFNLVSTKNLKVNFFTTISMLQIYQILFAISRGLANMAKTKTRNKNLKNTLQITSSSEFENHPVNKINYINGNTTINND